MRRRNNLITLFTAMSAFFFGTFLTNLLNSVEQRCPAGKSGVTTLSHHHHNLQQCSEHPLRYPELFLVILILSAPKHESQRNTMRNTWLQLGRPNLKLNYYPEELVYLPIYNKQGHLVLENVSDQANRLHLFSEWMAKDNTLPETAPERHTKVQHYFAIGTENLEHSIVKQLHKEQNEYGDLLFLPKLRDSYSNLTEKLLHSMDALFQILDFSYLLKVDDDTYVKLDYLLNELIAYDRKLLRHSKNYGGDPLPALYWGYFNGRSTIMSRGPWREVNYRLAKNYIPYALGGGYVLSRELCQFVTNHSHYLSKYVCEDVSMGTWLSPLRNVYRRHDPRFDTGYMPRKCRSEFLVLHKKTEVLMRFMYAEGIHCTFKDLVAKKKLIRAVGYYYDWNATVDNCCDNLL